MRVPPAGRRAQGWNRNASSSQGTPVSHQRSSLPIRPPTSSPVSVLVSTLTSTPQTCSDYSFTCVLISVHSLLTCTSLCGCDFTLRLILMEDRSEGNTYIYIYIYTHVFGTEARGSLVDKHIHLSHGHRSDQPYSYR